MKRPLLTRPEAEAEISDAFYWYEERIKGLGRRFLKELDISFRSIESNPRLFPKIYRITRRKLMRRFPYAIFFILEEDAVIILGVFHQARDPERWMRQISFRRRS